MDCPPAVSWSFVPLTVIVPGAKVTAKVPEKANPVKLVLMVPITDPLTPLEATFKVPPPSVRLTTPPTEKLKSLRVSCNPLEFFTKLNAAVIGCVPMVRVSSCPGIVAALIVPLPTET